MENFHFIEIKTNVACQHCNRKKLAETDKFYKLFAQDNDLNIVVCELCKVAFLTLLREGPERTFSTHLIFYVKNSLYKMEAQLPTNIKDELNCAIKNYENGHYSSSARSIGFVAEWLTERLFARKFGADLKDSKWEQKLGRLLDQARKSKTIPEVPIVFYLFSLKWLRNKVDHPSKYQITGEDVRMGLTSIIYLLHQTSSYNLI